MRLYTPRGPDQSSLGRLSRLMHEVTWVVRMMAKAMIVNVKSLHEGGETEAPVTEVACVVARVGAVPICIAQGIVPAIEKLVY